MNSKEALDNWYNTESPRTKAYEYELHYRLIKKDLEMLENIKLKTLLFYSDRKRIAKEYEKWCKDNNALVSDTTNMVTWMLGIKMKEWLDNE